MPAGYIQIWVISASHSWSQGSVWQSFRTCTRRAWGAEEDLPEQSPQGMGWLQHAADHPLVFMTWSMELIPLTACFYLGKPSLALRTKKKRNLLMVKMLSWERETEIWTRNLFFFSLFINTKIQNTAISCLPLFFCHNLQTWHFPYCSAWTGEIIPLPMTSLVLVASF